MNKYPKNAIVSIYIGFSFCFQKQGAFNLLFLLTTLKNRVVLSKSLFEDVKWALSNRKLGSFKTALKKARKMHKYAKTAFIKKRGTFCFFLVPTV